MESVNNVIKNDGTLRKRFRVKFCNLMKNKILKNFPTVRNPLINVEGVMVERKNCIKFSLEPTLQLLDWTKAYQLSSLKQDNVKYNNHYYMPDATKQTLVHKKE